MILMFSTCFRSVLEVDSALSLWEWSSTYVLYKTSCSSNVHRNWIVFKQGFPRGAWLFILELGPLYYHDISPTSLISKRMVSWISPCFINECDRTGHVKESVLCFTVCLRVSGLCMKLCCHTLSCCLWTATFIVSLPYSPLPNHPSNHSRREIRMGCSRPSQIIPSQWSSVFPPMSWWLESHGVVLYPERPRISGARESFELEVMISHFDFIDSVSCFYNLSTGILIWIISSQSYVIEKHVFGDWWREVWLEHLLSKYSSLLLSESYFWYSDLDENLAGSLKWFVCCQESSICSKIVDYCVQLCS